MMADDFSATIDAWVQKSEKRMLAVFRESAQRTVAIAQSRIPVSTGFARASIRASLSAMPPIDPSASKPAGGSVPYDSSEITLAIAQAKIPETIYIGWTANYVVYLEAGSSKQAPSGFVRLAAMEWSHTVAQVVEEAKARVG